MTEDALDEVRSRGVTLLGCGKMGGAMLEGWLAGGLPPSAVTVLDPSPTPRLKALAAQGLILNPDALGDAAVCLLAVKPQIMAEAAPRVAPLADRGTLFMSIAAGVPIRFFEGVFGAKAAIVRAMPNTPAAIGRGITALIGNAAADDARMRLAEALAAAIGRTVRLTDESQMDAVTAVSGSGPAYVFLMIEALARAGEDEGLPPDLAMTLARETVAGAGELARRSGKHPVEVMIDLGLESDFDQIFLQPLVNESPDAVLGMLRHPGTLATFSDSGAHVCQEMGASLQTHLLNYWVRKREAFTLEEGVRMLTCDNARAWGLTDRGLVREGMAADLVLFDEHRVRPRLPSVETDLPGGARRLVQRAEGIEATIVNGVMTLRAGEATGNHPGVLIRG